MGTQSANFIACALDETWNPAKRFKNSYCNEQEASGQGRGQMGGRLCARVDGQRRGQMGGRLCARVGGQRRGRMGGWLCARVGGRLCARVGRKSAVFTHDVLCDTVLLFSANYYMNRLHFKGWHEAVKGWVNMANIGAVKASDQLYHSQTISSQTIASVTVSSSSNQQESYHQCHQPALSCCEAATCTTSHRQTASSTVATVNKRHQRDLLSKIESPKHGFLCKNHPNMAFFHA